MRAAPAKQVKEDPDPSREFERPAPRGALRTALPWMAASAALFALSSWVAFTQAPHADVRRSLGWMDAEWWLYPIEANAVKRLPKISCDLNAILVLPDGRNVYAAGNLEMLAHSPDGGRTWVKLPANGHTTPVARSRYAPFAAWAQAKPKDDKSVSSSPVQQYPPRAPEGKSAAKDSKPANIRPGALQNPPRRPPPATPAPPPEVDRDDWVGIVHSGSGLLLVGTTGKMRVLRSDGKLYPHETRLLPQGRISSIRATPGVLVYNIDQKRNTHPLQGVWGQVRCGPIERPVEAKEIRAYACAGENQAWAAGVNGTILHTTDGGQRWDYQTQGSLAAALDQKTIYSRSPAPWYYLTSLVWLLPLVGLLLRVKEQRLLKQSVADVFVSDRPLEAGDPDPLKLNHLSGGLSRFLRNAATKPPLTIAVTGEWGTGKSSLMNLLRADLSAQGWRPVWFNAWHHQKEEHLLAALLQNVRMQALPRWWSFDALRLHWRLQFTRGPRHLAQLIFWAAVWFAVAGFVQVAGVNELLSANSTLPALEWETVIKLFPALGTLHALWKRTSAFGVNPASLLASSSSGAKAGDLEAQTSLRHRFAMDFREVTKAMGDRSLIVFIDDLDRCRPEHVLQVLEAVNFLASSGECYLVLGMARDKVEACVGLGFEEIASEMAGEGGDAHQQRRDYARQYLDKLINIEVPVPMLRADQTLPLLTGQGSLSPAKKSKARPGGAWALPAVAAAIVLIAAYQFGDIAGRQWRASRMIRPAPQQQPVAASVVSTAPPAPPSRGNGVQPAEHPNQAATLGRGIAPERSWFAASWAVHLLVFLLMIQFVQWRRERAEAAVEDSPEFVEALVQWHEAIFAANPTPRGQKRFLNRVRYLAMRLETESAAQRLPESKLVAMAALQLRDVGLADEAQLSKLGIGEQERSTYLAMASGIVVR